MAKMKTNTYKVWSFLKDNNGKDFTANDVAEALDLTAKQVNGIFTSALQRKELGYREEAEVELADGKHQTVKFLRLNEDGLSLEPEVEG